MNYDPEIVKSYLKDHPTETVAAVAAVTLFGVILFYRKKNKRLQINDITRFAPAVKNGGAVILKIDGLDYQFQRALI